MLKSTVQLSNRDLEFVNLLGNRLSREVSLVSIGEGFEPNLLAGRPTLLGGVFCKGIVFLFGQGKGHSTVLLSVLLPLGLFLCFGFHRSLDARERQGRKPMLAAKHNYFSLISC